MKTNQMPEWISRFVGALSKKKSSTDAGHKPLSLCEAKELLKGPGGQIARWRREREGFVKHPRETGEGGMIS